jgi:hypothetical protein
VQPSITDAPVNLISLRDFLLASEHLRVNISPQQVKGIFDILDYDGNGKLSYAEFCQLAVEDQRLALLEKNKHLSGGGRYLTPLQRELNNPQNMVPQKFLSPVRTEIEPDSKVISFDHMAFIHRENNRVNHYMSPECAGYYPERSEVLGAVIKTEKPSGNPLMSPLRGFMYKTSSGFHSSSQ